MALLQNERELNSKSATPCAFVPTSLARGFLIYNPTPNEKFSHELGSWLQKGQSSQLHTQKSALPTLNSAPYTLL